MIDGSHIVKALGERGLAAAARKRRGGDADSDGGDFESEFALTRLLELTHRCRADGTPGEDVKLAAQVEGFVDDFYECMKGDHTYVETKSSSVLSWTRPIRTNFLRQIKILRINRISATLVLTVSNSQLAEKLLDNARGALRSVKVKSFAMNWPWAHRAIRGLANGSPDEHEVRGLAYILMGVWRGSRKLRSLTDIVEEWKRHSGGRIRTGGKKLPSPALLELLAHIPYTQFYINDEAIEYIHNEFAADFVGKIPIAIGTPEWTEFELALLNADVRCYDDFRHVLMGMLAKGDRA